MNFVSVPKDYPTCNANAVWTVYDVNSTNPAFLNYKYVAELFISGTKVFTSRVFPRPTSNVGVFELSSVIREYIEAKLSPAGNGIEAQEMGVGDFIINTVLKIREEYNGTIGEVVLEDSSRTFYNYYDSTFTDITSQEGFNYTFDFIFGFLNNTATDRPTTVKSFLTNRRLFIPYLALTNAPFDVTIGANVKTITPSQAISGQLINISPVAINQDFPGTITSITESYTVDIAGTTYTVQLVCEPLITQYPIHFLNKAGLFETFVFSKVTKKLKEFERKQFMQQDYKISDAGVVTYQTNQVLNNQIVTFGNRIKESLIINSDYLNDAEWEWLYQLVASPIIYLENQNTLYPITLKDTNYEAKINAFDGLNLLTLNVDLGFEFKTQFR